MAVNIVQVLGSADNIPSARACVVCEYTDSSGWEQSVCP